MSFPALTFYDLVLTPTSPGDKAVFPRICTKKLLSSQLSIPLCPLTLLSIPVTVEVMATLLPRGRGECGKKCRAGRLGAWGVRTEGRSKLFKVSQIKNNFVFSGTLDFCDVGNEFLPGNLGVICQDLSQREGEGEKGGQVTLAAA